MIQGAEEIVLAGYLLFCPLQSDEKYHAKYLVLFRDGRLWQYRSEDEYL